MTQIISKRITVAPSVFALTVLCVFLIVFGGVVAVRVNADASVKRAMIGIEGERMRLLNNAMENGLLPQQQQGQPQSFVPPIVADGTDANGR